MRVGHFVPHYPGGGGITSMVLGSAGGLLGAGHQVVVYGYRAGTPHDEDRTRAQARGIGVTERVAASSRSAIGLRVRPDAILRSLSRNADRLDVIVVHGIFGPYAPVIARAARRGGIASIACPHDPYAPEIFVEHRLVKRAYLRLIELPYLRSVQAVHLLAPSHEAFLRRLGVDAPVFILPNGLPRVAFERPVPGGLGRGDGALRLLYLGRWDMHNKGLDLLLDAIRSAVHSNLQVQLRIGGRGSTGERAAIEQQMAMLGVEGSVRLEGFLDDRDAAIREADALVLPSRFDGFGQVVIESLSLGTPVVVSSRAGASEHLGPADGVVVVDPTVEGVTSGIRRVAAESGALREKVREARGSLGERFSWDRIATRWVTEVSRIGTHRGAETQ